MVTISSFLFSSHSSAHRILTSLYIILLTHITNCLLVAKSSQCFYLKFISPASIRSLSPHSLPRLFISVRSLLRFFLLYLLFKYLFISQSFTQPFFLPLYIFLGWSHLCLQFLLPSTKPFLLVSTHMSSYNGYPFSECLPCARSIIDS